MMDFATLTIGDLSAGSIVAILLYINHILRKDLESERLYSRYLTQLYQESTQKTIETMMKLEAAFKELKGGLK